LIPQINKNLLSFPHPNTADAEGLLAWGGDLSPQRLIHAYQNGIFPWYSKSDPILWWSPNPRLIMEIDDFKLSKSLKKSIKKFDYKFDSNFQNVIYNCSVKKRKTQQESWIQNEIIEAYTKLNELGIAHSVEAYQNGELIGGLYGLSIGKVFCGESMFTHVNDASKAAYAILIRHLKKWEYDFIDCQIPTQHLKSLGAKEVSRDYFLQRLEKSNITDLQQIWNIDKELL